MMDSSNGLLDQQFVVLFTGPVHTHAATSDSLDCSYLGAVCGVVQILFGFWVWHTGRVPPHDVEVGASRQPSLGVPLHLKTRTINISCRTLTARDYLHCHISHFTQLPQHQCHLVSGSTSQFQVTFGTRQKQIQQKDQITRQSEYCFWF